MQRPRHRDLNGVVPDAAEIAAVGETDEEPFRRELLETLRALIDSDADAHELGRPHKRVLRLVR